MSTSITIIIPCHRQDERLIRAIKSAQWADEVLLIDQNSQIDWEAIEKTLRYTVMKYPDLTSFSAMRNEALKKVTTQWAFFLDSDEFITTALQKKVEETLTDASIDGVQLRRVDMFLGKKLFHGETRSAKFTRIVKIDRAEWRGAAHEELVMHPGTKVIELKTPLYHEPHTSVFEFIQKINIYTTLLAQQDEPFVVIKSVFLPLGKFFYTFYIKLGFLDGYRGLVYSFIMSMHSSVVRIKRYEHFNH